MKPPPVNLIELQHWFGANLLLCTPLTDIEIKRWVVSEGSLSAEQRFGIYREQYWERLLEVLQKQYPLLVHKIGLERFNVEVALPFLQAHPPMDYRLCYLGEKLSFWLHERSLPELALLAEIDWAFEKAFWSASTPIKEVTENSFFILQPHSSLFALDEDLLSLRQHILAYPTENPLPATGHFLYLIYRSCEQQICFESISHIEYLILLTFKKGGTLKAALQFLSQNPISPESLSLWFFYWTKNNIISILP